MKTAEEFIANYRAERRLFLDGNITDEQRKLKWLNGDLLREVQLDAFKAGAEWASSKLDNLPSNYAEYVRNTIKSAASSLKEIPK